MINTRKIAFKKNYCQTDCLFLEAILAGFGLLLRGVSLLDTTGRTYVRLTFRTSMSKNIKILSFLFEINEEEEEEEKILCFSMFNWREANLHIATVTTTTNQI